MVPQSRLGPHPLPIIVLPPLPTPHTISLGNPVTSFLCYNVCSHAVLSSFLAFFRL